MATLATSTHYTTTDLCQSPAIDSRFHFLCVKIVAVIPGSLHPSTHPKVHIVVAKIDQSKDFKKADLFIIRRMNALSRVRKAGNRFVIV